jgi:hypothetical protein
VSTDVANPGSAGTPGAVPPGLKPWKPGQSGNPSGRSREIAAVETLARSHSKEAIEKLVAIMRGKNVKEARLAAEAILDRGLGKAAVAVNLTATAAPLDTRFRGAARAMLEAAVEAAEQLSGESTVYETVAVREGGDENGSDTGSLERKALVPAAGCAQDVPVGPLDAGEGAAP